MSEAMLSMVLDIEVDRHKREVADGFAKARARLIPAPKPKPLDPHTAWQIAMAQSQQGADWLRQCNMAAQNNAMTPFNHGQSQLSSALYFGLGGCFWA